MAPAWVWNLFRGVLGAMVAEMEGTEELCMAMDFMEKGEETETGEGRSETGEGQNRTGEPSSFQQNNRTQQGSKGGSKKTLFFSFFLSLRINE
jgi:hypothetical protein